MPNFGSLWPGRRRSYPPPTEADVLADAIQRNPPTRHDADAAYGAFFRRLADQAVVSYRSGKAVEVTLDAGERTMLGTEVAAVITGLRCYVQHALGLSGEPHIECDLRGGAVGQPIALRVTR